MLFLRQYDCYMKSERIHLKGEFAYYVSGQIPSNIQFNQLKKIYQKHKISDGLLVCRIERMGHIISDQNYVGEGALK